MSRPTQDDTHHLRLGSIDKTDCFVARTSTPWQLGIDSIIVSVGNGPGGLAAAVQDAIPDGPWPSARYEKVLPGRPRLLELDRVNSEKAGSRLRTVVLATPHSRGGNSPITSSAIRTATTSAIDAAANAGAQAIGLPLLAAGRLRRSPNDTAQVVIPAALDALRSLGTHAPKHLVFICEDGAAETAIKNAWTIPREEEPTGADPATSPGDDGTSRPPPPTPEPDPSREPAISDFLAGGTSSDLVDPNTGIALHKDRLGVAPYVSMLATVIADRRTPLPLSVGIFGEWGTGKSYFMGLLRAQIDELAQSGSDTYCADIAQIGFNAWHYSDSNLWASLGDEIFRQLAGPGDDGDLRRERIRSELADKLEQRRELEETARQAQDQAATLQAGIDDALADRDRSAITLLEVLRSSETVRRRLDEVWNKLGITDEIEQGRSLAEQLRGTASEAAALRRTIKGPLGVVFCGLASVVLLCFGITTFVAPHLAPWLAGSGFAVLLGGALTAVTRARSGLRMLRELTEELRSGARDAASQEHQATVSDAVAALRKVEAIRQVAEAQLESLLSRVGELQRELVELAPGRRLYTFLADRAGSDSYARNLGLISTIRKDFEELVALMARWREAGPDTTAPRPVDRVVLYIDDLDRCSPRQVVDVLQAVHLLLALELFVVVVGVDPRWLVRALCHHYDELLDTGEHDTGRDGWHVAPEDYLEKILNIPLVLPGMPRGGLRQVIHGLIEDDVEHQAREDGSRFTVPAPEPPIGSADGSESWNAMPIETGSEVAAIQQGTPVPPPRPLTDPEIDLLASLDLLVTTPREAKRLVNLYRMLRSTRDLSDASTFLGDQENPGEYQAVVVLLGLLTAHGHLLGAVLDAPQNVADDVGGGLMSRPASQSWSGFLTDMTPRRSATDVGWVNGVIGTIEGDAVRAWTHLTAGLHHASRSVQLTELATFQRWAPRVRRFSFVLTPSSGGPMAAAPPDRSAETASM